MAGEFVRTPKKGATTGVRYRTTALALPLAETLLFCISLCATIASTRTGHVIATPFAALFTAGYGYMAVTMIHEQLQRIFAQRVGAEPPAMAVSPVASDAE
jgi:hypothetical protein